MYIYIILKNIYYSTNYYSTILIVELWRFNIIVIIKSLYYCIDICIEIQILQLHIQILHIYQFYRLTSC